MVELSDKFQLLTRLPNFGITVIYYLSSESVSRIVPDGVSTGYPTSRTAIPSIPPNDEGDRQSHGERPRRTADRGGPLSNEPPVLGGYPLLDRVVQTVGRMTRDRLAFS